jgi:hypothetical protein
MRKEFIPYQQALALKELGFDEPCFGKYLSSVQSDWKDFELILEMGMNEEFEDNRNIYLLEEACSAPTFSQAFRWFREKYGLGHMINGIGYESFIMNIGGVLHIFNAFDFETYEEAELACLNKLIEIVKQ